jgi:hypothetical protein
MLHQASAGEVSGRWLPAVNKHEAIWPMPSID